MPVVSPRLSFMLLSATTLFAAPIGAACDGQSNDTAGIAAAPVVTLVRVTERTSDPTDLFQAQARSLQIAPGAVGRLFLSVGVREPGRYHLSVTAGSGWSVSLADGDAARSEPTTANSFFYVVTQQQLSTGSGPAGEMTFHPELSLMADAAGAQPTDITLAIARDGDPATQRVVYPVALRP